MPFQLSRFDRNAPTLFFDPGFSCTGFAELEPIESADKSGKVSLGVSYVGFIRTPRLPGDTTPSRMARFIESVKGFPIEETQATQVIVEEPNYWESKKGRASARRGNLALVMHSFSAIVTIALLHGYKVWSITPQQWKGQARKHITQRRMLQAMKKGLLVFPRKVKVCLAREKGSRSKPTGFISRMGREWGTLEDAREHDNANATFLTKLMTNEHICDAASMGLRVFQQFHDVGGF